MQTLYLHTISYKIPKVISYLPKFVDAHSVRPTIYIQLYSKSCQSNSANF